MRSSLWRLFWKSPCKIHNNAFYFRGMFYRKLCKKFDFESSEGDLKVKKLVRPRHLGLIVILSGFRKTCMQVSKSLMQLSACSLQMIKEDV